MQSSPGCNSIDLLSKYFFSLVGISLFLAITLSFCAIVPPFQSPDEFVHAYSAIAAINGDWLSASDGRYTSVDKNFLLYQNLYQSLPFKPYSKLDAYTRSQAKFVHWSGDNTRVSLSGASQYPPTFYFFQGAGLGIGKLLSLPIHQSYQLARLLNVLATAIGLFLAFRLFKHLRLGILFLAISPMFVFQAASCSPDSQFTLAALLAIGFSLRVLEQHKLSISRDYLLATGFTALVAMMKAPYFGLFAFLVPPLFHHRDTALKQVIVLAIALSLVLFWIKQGSAGLAVFHRPGIDIHAQVHNLIFHPFSYLGILHTTFCDYGHGYLLQLFGVLGWLDTPLPAVAYSLGLFGFLAILIVQGVAGPPLSISLRLLALIVTFTVIILIMTTLYIVWTPVAAPRIEGVQGRYFMPFVPLLIAAVGGWGLPVHSFWFRVSALSLLTVGILAVLVATIFGLKAVVDRYYIPAPELSLEFVPDIKSYSSNGWVDSLVIDDAGKVTISGWAYIEAERAWLLLTLKPDIIKDVQAFRLERPDIIRFFNNENLRLSGFSLTFNILNDENVRVQTLQALCIGSRDQKGNLYRLNVASGVELCK